MENTKRAQYVDGSWIAALNGGTRVVLDPATEQPIATVPFGDGADAERAIEAAERAFPLWAAQTPYARAAVLKKAADSIRLRTKELGRTTTLESGKPLLQSEGEWSVAADLLEWFAEEGKRAYGRVIPSRKPDRRLMVLKQPLGVVGVITAWNFPIYNPARACAAALAAGCSVVLRPSEYTPLTGFAFAEVLDEAGLPSGVLNVINGDPASMGQALLDSSVVRKIHLTGSPRVGRLLMEGASKTVKRLSLELGGNAPVLVFPDVDVAAVAASAVAAKFRNSGQVCVAPQRFLVHRSIHAEFVQTISTLAQALRVGPGSDAQTQVGPLINKTQRDHVVGLVEAARTAGATVLCGGAIPETYPQGYFYQPTVVTEVLPSMRVFAEEIFGPVLPVTTFEEFDEAIELANRTEFGLAAYVWTNSLGTATRAYERLEFGMIGVNEWTPHATEAPFIGWKESGLGSESGAEGLEEYMEKKLVSLGGI